MTAPQLLDRMCMTLGGRVAEEIFFGEITTGAQDDLRKITRTAFEICANYGMNTTVGPVSYGGAEGQHEAFQKPFSEKTAQMLDEQVRNMITYVLILKIRLLLLTFPSTFSDAHRRTHELLTAKRAEVEKVATLLLKKEVITRYSTISPKRYSAKLLTSR